MPTKTIHRKTPVAASLPTQKAINIALFDVLADSAYIRESQLVTSSDKPDLPVPLPFSAQTLWRKVKARDFPQPIKLSERVTAWRVGDVRAWLAQRTAESARA